MPKAERRIGDAVERISKLAGSVSSLLVAAMMIALVVDVVHRNVLGSSVPGVLEYSEIAMVIIVYLSLSFAQFSRSHVTVDIVMDRVPERIAKVIDSVVLILVGAFLLWMAYQTTRAAGQSWQTGEYRFGLATVPLWPARFAIPLGFVAMGIQCFVQGLGFDSVHRQDSEPISVI